jgi:polar amino acid transport system substrate-binding protein
MHKWETYFETSFLSILILFYQGRGRNFMRKTTLLIIFTLQFVLFSAITSFATNKWIISCENDYPPYNFIDDIGIKTGLDTDIVKAVLSYLKISYSLNFVSWKELLDALNNDKLDLAYQFVGYPERFEQYEMVGPIRSSKTVFAVHKFSNIYSFTSLKDLKTLTIGYINGWSYTPEFDSANFLDKDPANNYEELIKRLIKRRDDLIIGDIRVIEYIAKTINAYDSIRFLPEILREAPRYVAFPKQKKKNAQMFQEGLEAIKKNGSYDIILKRWEKYMLNLSK